MQKIYKNTLLSFKESFCSKNNLTKVEERISHITSRFKFQQIRLILAEKKVLICLTDLHETLVLIPIGNDSNSIAIICKKSYVHKTLLEVAIYSDHSGTYLSNKCSSDCYWTRTHNPLVCKPTLNHLAKFDQFG